MLFSGTEEDCGGSFYCHFNGSPVSLSVILSEDMPKNKGTGNILARLCRKCKGPGNGAGEVNHRMQRVE